MNDIQLLVDRFCDHASYIRGVSNETLRRYRQQVGMYQTHVNVIHIEEVTDENVRAFMIYGRTDRHWSPATFIVYHNTMKVFFRWCQQQGLLSDNPMRDLELPKVPKKLPRALSKDDAAKLLEVIYNYPYPYTFLRYRNHALFSTYIHAGLRKSEALQLRVTDIDFENKSIFVRQGKGSKDRIVPMSFTLAQSLRRYEMERKRLRKTCPEFFTSLNRNKGYTDSGLKRVLDQMREASGIYFTVHQLRHTFATLMLEGGCDIVSISKMLGHSKITTTMIYVAASVGHLREQIMKHPLDKSMGVPHKMTTTESSSFAYTDM